MHLIADHEDELRIIPRGRPTIFQEHLPSYVQEQILTLAVTYEHGYTVNLDTPTGRQSLSGLLFSSRDMLDQYGKYSWAKNFLSLEVTTTKTHSNFDNFERLGAMLRSKISTFARSYDAPKWEFCIDAHFQIVLIFRLEEHSTLQDVRISIMPFIFATFTTRSERNLVIIVESPLSTHKHTISLYDLRHVLMDALSPGSWPPTPDGPCPEILVNGLGKVVGILPASAAMYKTWLNAHALYATPEDQWVDEDWCYFATEPPFPFDGTVGSVYSYIWGVTYHVQDRERWYG